MPNLAQMIGDYSNPNSIGSKFRRRRSGPLRELIERVHAKSGRVSILDIGGMENYWGIVTPEYLTAFNVRIVLLNLKADVQPPQRPDIFTAEEGDGCAVSYADDSFDICHANSVIEHVGGWQRKTQFAAECRRLAPHYFIQTPNYWFFWEPHFGMPFYHWLPEPMRLWLAMHRKLGWTPRATNLAEGMHTVEYASLLTGGMMRYLFPDGRIVRERVLGVTKSFTAIR